MRLTMEQLQPLESVTYPGIRASAVLEITAYQVVAASTAKVCHQMAEVLAAMFSRRSTDSMGLTIGKAARAAGVNVETIRFYERRGLIEQPRKPDGHGYRQYSLTIVARIRFIRKSQALGFSLREIEDLLSLETDTGADCGDVQERAAAKIEDLDHKIAELVRMRTALEQIAATCPGCGAPLRSCSIMEALSNSPYQGHNEDCSSRAGVPGVPKST
jgi:MerR family copper efflux transcriptional regulator